MRIISGKFRGRRFSPPLKKCNTRPTMDMAKEALFNILINSYDFEDLDVLDLFGGTGSISIEFISRGCENVSYVDNFHLCNKFVNTIKDTLHLDKELKIIKYDAIKFLETTSKKYDIIFADPPYDFKKSKALIDVIFEKDILNIDGVFIYEHDKRHDFSIFPNYSHTKKYGTNLFSFFV